MSSTNTDWRQVAISSNADAFEVLASRRAVVKRMLAKARGERRSILIAEIERINLEMDDISAQDAALEIDDGTWNFPVEWVQ